MFYATVHLKNTQNRYIYIPIIYIFLKFVGELPPKEENESSPNANPEIALEELRAKHLRELQELQLQHQRQLEEEARKLQLNNQSQPPAVQHPVIPTKTGSGSVTIKKAVTPSSKDETPINRMDALKAKPGTQIKITRTPTGSVEFTTIPASGLPISGNAPAFGNGNAPQMAVAPPPPPQKPPQVSAARFGFPKITKNKCSKKYFQQKKIKQLHCLFITIF